MNLVTLYKIGRATGSPWTPQNLAIYIVLQYALTTCPKAFGFLVDIAFSLLESTATVLSRQSTVLMAFCGRGGKL
jgi:hypothetical protein